MLDITEANERAIIGDNNPPPASALDTWKDHAESLRERSVGIVITNDEQAAKVEDLVVDAKTALSDIKSAITEERRPHMDAANKISADFKPAVDSIEAVKAAAVKVAGDWRDAQERKKAEELAEARRKEREAEEAAARARAEADETEADDIARVQEAEAEVKRAAMASKKVNTRKVSSGGVRMKTEYTATITDARALWAHIAKVDPDAITTLLQSWVEPRKKDGDIPGVTIRSKQKAA